MFAEHLDIIKKLSTSADEDDDSENAYRENLSKIFHSY